MFKWLKKLFEKPECKDFPVTVYENCDRFEINLSSKEMDIIATFDCDTYTKTVEPSAYYNEEFETLMILETKGVVYRTEIDGYLKWHIASEFLGG